MSVREPSDVPWRSELLNGLKLHLKKKLPEYGEAISKKNTDS